MVSPKSITTLGNRVDRAVDRALRSRGVGRRPQDSAEARERADLAAASAPVYNERGERLSVIVPKKQRRRIQVKMPFNTWEAIEPFMHDPRYVSSVVITRIAEGLTLTEALKLIYEETPVKGKSGIVHITPTEKLLSRAQGFYVTPQVLLRAALDKIGNEITLYDGDVAAALETFDLD